MIDLWFKNSWTYNFNFLYNLFIIQYFTKRNNFMVSRIWTFMTLVLFRKEKSRNKWKSSWRNISKFFKFHLQAKFYDKNIMEKQEFTVPLVLFNIIIASLFSAATVPGICGWPPAAASWGPQWCPWGPLGPLRHASLPQQPLPLSLTRIGSTLLEKQHFSF